MIESSFTCGAYAYQVTRRYSIVVSSVTLVALNALLFTAEISPSIPLVYSRVALLGLSFVGLIGIPYSLDLLNKVCEDTRAAFRESQKILMFVTSIKAFTLFCNIVLIGWGAWAALKGLNNDLYGQREAYEKMIPIGLLSLEVSFVLLFAYLILNRQALNQAESMNPFRITALIRSIIDKDTLAELTALSPEEQAESKAIIVNNLRTQLKYVQGADLLMQLLGFALMAVEKWYTPDSAVSSGINLGVSSLWCLKLAREKWLESSQRNAISEAFLSPEEWLRTESPPQEMWEDRSDFPLEAHAV
jgi:hypothetical protein